MLADTNFSEVSKFLNNSKSPLPNFSDYEREKEIKKEKKICLPHIHVKYIQRFVGLSEYDYTRKMLNKNHLGKVPSKVVEH